LTEFSDYVAAPYYGDEEATEDWGVATRGLANQPTVTRMRAELPANALGEDLVLRASSAGPRPGVYIVTHAYDSDGRTSPSRAGTAIPLPGLFTIGAIVAWLLRPRRRRVRAVHR
jgi:hypothetical protein